MQLEKQVKDLNVRIIDFEMKSYGTPTQPSANMCRLEIHLEELTNQLNEINIWIM